MLTEPLACSELFPKPNRRFLITATAGGPSKGDDRIYASQWPRAKSPISKKLSSALLARTACMSITVRSVAPLMGPDGSLALGFCAMVTLWIRALDLLAGREVMAAAVLRDAEIGPETVTAVVMEAHFANGFVRWICWSGRRILARRGLQRDVCDRCHSRDISII